jgi:glycosyltransferase involved in cell wall biosynthesis
MSVSILTFANLGRKANLPTVDILPVITAFVERGKLEQIICQINDHFTFENTLEAIPPLIRYPLRVLEKVFHIPVSRRFVEKLFDFFASRKLKDADVVFFHGGFFLPRTLREAKRRGLITVDIARTAHLETNAQIESEEGERLDLVGYEGAYTGLERTSRHCNDFEYVIAMSDFVKETYVKSGFPAERIFVAVPDIDTARFSYQGVDIKNKPFQYLYIAHTQPIKGLHYLLEAWKGILPTEATLLIVGDFSDMPQQLKDRYIETIQKIPGVTWLPTTDTPEKYYRESSVFVFPSLTESFGRVIAEAMISGLPVITTENARGLVEDGKSGFVVPIRDSSALREKIEYLYHNPEVVTKMGQEARKAVENKKPFGEAVYEIYQEILKREGKI